MMIEYIHLVSSPEFTFKAKDYCQLWNNAFRPSCWYEFQGLIAGVLSLIAAILTIAVVWITARSTDKREKKFRREDNERKGLVASIYMEIEIRENNKTIIDIEEIINKDHDCEVIDETGSYSPNNVAIYKTNNYLSKVSFPKGMSLINNKFFPFLDKKSLSICLEIDKSLRHIYDMRKNNTGSIDSDDADNYLSRIEDAVKKYREIYNKHFPNA